MDKSKINRSKKKLGSKMAHRILRHIEKDEFHKLQSLFANNTIIDPDTVLDSRNGRTGLHMACKLGRYDCIQVFLRNGASKLSQDYKGNTGKKKLNICNAICKQIFLLAGLHLATKYCLKRCIRGHHNTDTKVVDAILSNDKHLINVPNHKGTTPKVLLKALDKFQEISDDQESTDDDNGQALEWNRKLKEAEEAEHFEMFGKFEQDWNDGNFKNAFNETFDQWADRIASEFRKRKHSLYQVPLPPPPPKEKKMELKKIKVERKPSVDDTKVQIEKLFNSTDVIKAKNLPFNEETPPDQIVQELIGNASNNCKSIKEVLRRWHPDKFYQLLHNRIHPGHKDKVIRIVTHISQALLNFGRK